MKLFCVSILLSHSASFEPAVILADPFQKEYQNASAGSG